MSEFEEMNLYTLEKFLLKEFKRSVEEWIIDFNELHLDNLIATGSTCKVYKGKYKNISVAIKKITGVQNVKKMKFLKEFKREIALLISLPAHSSLLTLIGFCIEENDVYLVTEFCEGGTLFDIIYRKGTNFKLSYKQKLKILLDIAKGMQFLNELKKPIIHRDLKTLKFVKKHLIR